MNRISVKVMIVLVVFALVLSPTLWASEASGQDDFNATTKWTDSTAGTPLDVSSLVLDAPAGKHGFLTTQEGHFYFKDGTRIRFWGTNLSYTGLFPTHAEADRLADKLAALGFNAVRLHGPDTEYSGASLIDLSKQDTQHLDPVAMDRFDYLISKLKTKGIYIATNVHYARKYKSGDSVIDYDKVPAGASKYDLFDDRMIQLSKDWASTVFTHVNRYTGLALKDDPVLALLEITNEDSLFDGWITGQLDGTASSGNLLPSYRAKLDEKFNQYLRDKYGTQDVLAEAWRTPVSTGNLLSNGDFKQKYTDDWTVSTKGTVTVAPVWDDSNPNKNTRDMQLLKVRSYHSSYDDGVLSQSGVKLKKGHTYQIRFYAKIVNGSAATLKVRFQNSQTGYAYGLDKNVTLDPVAGWKQYTMTFMANEDTTNLPEAALTFNFGWVWGDVSIDNVELTEVQLKALDKDESIDSGTIVRTPWSDRANYTPQRIRDVTQFYYDTLVTTFSGIKDHLRNSIGIKIPITTTQNYVTNTEIMARSEVGDYMDGHLYWDPPTFPSQKWDANHFAVSNRSLIESAGNVENSRLFNKFVDFVALNRVEGKPFVVGEWQMGFPNDYEFEAAPVISSYAQLQDWDGLFIYQYCGTCKYSRGEDNKIGFLNDIYGNPAKIAQMPASAVSFIKGYIKPASQSVVVNYNNVDVLDRNIVDGYLYNYNTNIGRGLPTAVLYRHRFAKAFQAISTSQESQLLSAEEDQSLISEQRHVSDTGELIWDTTKAGSENLIIDTPMSQSITGFITDKTFSSTNLKTMVTAKTHPFGSISLQPIDDTKIWDSKNMLLTIVSKQYNVGQSRDANHGLSSYGRGPTMMQALNGQVDISTNLAGVDSVKINQLDTQGHIVRQLPVSTDRVNNKIMITLDSLSSPYLQVIKSY